MAIAKETRLFAAEQADRLLSRLAFQLNRTIKSHDADQVHDLRVAIRRFTQALIAFKPCFPRREIRTIHRRLKKIMVLAGDVRNCDIAMKLLPKLKFPASIALLREFRNERTAAEQPLLRSLKRWVVRRSSSRWRTGLETAAAANRFSHRSIHDTAKRTLSGMMQDFFTRGGEAARQKASPEQLHQFRLAAKRLRYTLELFAPLYGPSVNAMLEQIRSVQTYLGAVNDCETVRSMVEAYRDNQGVDAALKRKQRRQTAEFRRRWAETYSHPDTMHRWMRKVNHFAVRRRLAA
jgi:CHAD domain-containing protein